MMELLILSELKVGTLCFFTVLCALPWVLNNPYVQLIFDNGLFNP